MIRGVLLLATLTTAEKISLVLAAIAVVGLLVAVFNAWTAVVHERRRTQPIVISHEEHGRVFTDNSDYFAVGGFLTNESSGHAFNVRFGVEFDGVRYPQKMSADDPDAGNIQRVLRPSERRPGEGSWPILISQLSLVGGSHSDPDPRRVYWARYENARGQTWETRNPWDRSAYLHIRRVRAVRLREWLEQRQRDKARTGGLDWERKALTELQQAAQEASEAPAETTPKPQIPADPRPPPS
jgi:hypothetical protein